MEMVENMPEDVILRTEENIDRKYLQSDAGLAQEFSTTDEVSSLEIQIEDPHSRSAVISFTEALENISNGSVGSWSINGTNDNSVSKKKLAEEFLTSFGTSSWWNDEAKAVFADKSTKILVRVESDGSLLKAYISGPDVGDLLKKITADVKKRLHTAGIEKVSVN